MKLKLVLHRPYRHALIDGIPPAPPPFEIFLSGHGLCASAEGPGRDAGGPDKQSGLLEAFFHYRDAAADPDDMIGFDNPSNPLFIDPFSTHAEDPLSASLETLRHAASNVWRAFAITVDRRQAAAY